LINWGILPFIINDETAFGNDSFIFIPGIAKAVREKEAAIACYVLGEKTAEITATLGELTDNERQILLDGCLINHYAR
jgi:aconitate hydratase